MESLAKERKRHTYSDYLSWTEGRWELIEGVVHDMTPPPSRRHQHMVGEIFFQIKSALRRGPCEVYNSPFDVRLPSGGEGELDCTTVVQPDVLVYCDRARMDERGGIGAPDFVAEVLSPSTAAKDRIEKVALYEKHGVKELWLVDPHYRLLTVRVLEEEAFGTPRDHELTGTLKLASLDGVTIVLDMLIPPEEREEPSRVAPMGPMK